MRLEIEYPVKSYIICKGRVFIVDTTLWLLFILMPFVDAATGYLINKEILAAGSVGSPSQLFRFILTALLIIQIRKPLYLYVCMIMIVWIMIVESINLSLHSRLEWFLIGGVYSYKLVFGLIVYFVFKEYFNKHRLTYDVLQNFIINSCAIYTLIIIVSDMIGISASSYAGADLGSKGIFADGNGLGVFLGASSLVVLNRYTQEKKIKDLFIFILTGKVLVGLMSKAGLLFLLAGLFLLYCNQRTEFKVVVGIVLLLCAFFLWEPIFLMIKTTFQVITWRVERSDSFWEIILGGRELYLYEAAGYDYTNFIQVFKLIVGGGYKLSFRDPSATDYDPDGIFLIEADFFDVFFMYGIIGFIAYIIIFFKGLCTPKVHGKNILKWAWVLLFIHSALAGHVLSSGTALLILPCILLLMEKRKYLSNSASGKETICC